jgi:hypothetical protein
MTGKNLTMDSWTAELGKKTEKYNRFFDLAAQLYKLHI